MEREAKLLYEATLDDLVEELNARFPSGTVVGIVRKDSTFSLRCSGDHSICCQLTRIAAQHLGITREE